MTKFETRGVTLQQLSETKNQAEDRFKHSCSLCCKMGLRIECDRCAIQVIHDQIIGNLPAMPSISIRFA